MVTATTSETESLRGRIEDVKRSDIEAGQMQGARSDCLAPNKLAKFQLRAEQTLGNVLTARQDRRKERVAIVN